MSLDHPILAVITTDKNQSLDGLISNIRKLPVDSDTCEYRTLKVYIHNVITKYYETKIALLPLENLDSTDDIVKSKIEGIMIYFDPKNRSILDSIHSYKEFILQNNIEFSLLLCSKLMENEEDGVTFDCIKKRFNKFDIIELDRKADEEDDSFSGPYGYDELQQALEGFKIPDCSADNLLDDEEEASEESLERELEKFENLLTQAMQFRPNTEHMSREDRLNCAQSFAEVFEKLILQDNDDVIPDE